jgi:hypothetical protein
MQIYRRLHSINLKAQLFRVTTLILRERTLRSLLCTII